MRNALARALRINWMVLDGLRGASVAAVPGENQMRRFGQQAVVPFAIVAVAILGIAVTAEAHAQVRFDAEAVRLNNRGVAQMGQQFTDRAANSFADAFKKNPKLAQVAVNEGIALLYLQKPDETETWLKQAIAIDPLSARAWYNLGLAQHAGNELDAALASFQQASRIDPADADSYYFQGVCYQEMKQFDQAIAVLAKALEIDPLHASAEYQIARALQRSGHTAAAKTHFQRFQHLTGAKISSAIGLSYGEQGHYSTVEAIQEPETIKKAMIPVKLVAQPLLSTPSNRPHSSPPAAHA